MITKTRADLRAQVREAADIESATARHTDDQVNGYVNRGMGVYHAVLTEVAGEMRSSASTTLTMVSGTSTYSLPSTCFRVVEVRANYNGQTLWLLPFSKDERVELSDTSVGWSGAPHAYGITGTSSIEFLPVPSSGYTVDVRYITDAAQLWDDVTTFDSLSRCGDEFVTQYAARLVCQKDGRDDQFALCDRLMREAEARVRRYARRLDGNAPKRINDVRTAEYDAGRRWRLGR